MNSSKYHNLRLKDVINLAAPSTWAASVMPSILAVTLAYFKTGEIDALMAICLFMIAILMQSSVNTLNDYADYKKGTDTISNSPDASDAVIVYGLNPIIARNLGIVFLLYAGIIGLYSVCICGIELLIIGLIGALVILCYSLGKLPISYLPIGEVVSGFVMGGLIPLAGYFMQTKEMDYTVFLYALPIIIGISMIMLSNNGCDIEKDIPANRHTLATILGKDITSLIYKRLLIIWMIFPIIVYAIIGRYTSILIYLLELPVLISSISRQLSYELGQNDRGKIMAGISNLNICIGFAYMLALII